MAEREARAQPSRLSLADQDLLTVLARRDEGLSILLHLATKYRARLQDSLRRLRTGTEPAAERVALEQWAPMLRELRKVARQL